MKIPPEIERIIQRRMAKFYADLEEDVVRAMNLTEYDKLGRLEMVEIYDEHTGQLESGPSIACRWR